MIVGISGDCQRGERLLDSWSDFETMYITNTAAYTTIVYIYIYCRIIYYILNYDVFFAMSSRRDCELNVVFIYRTIFMYCKEYYYITYIFFET